MKLDLLNDFNKCLGMKDFDEIIKNRYGVNMQVVHSTTTTYRGRGL